ncbi:UNVERIFIED_CONTAM: hypothetical protein K2H54_060927, partial [Gekko kuhli]
MCIGGRIVPPDCTLDSLSSAEVSLRYLRSDGKLNAVVFSNVPLADGKRHAVLLRLSDLQRGSSKAELYVDCRQMDSVQDLPKAFSGLAQSSEAVELRTLQKKAQDFLEELKLVVRGSLSQVASLQDCFLPQIEPSIQDPGVSTSDFNRQLLGHMMQMNQILGDVKDLLRQQVCLDVDECQNNANGGCVPNSQCINTVGSYRCGACKAGFTGDQVRGCRAERSCRNRALNPCSIYAQCTEVRQGDISCVCGIGWAGNGFVCGKDVDIDGYPDEELSCSAESCRK